MSDTTHPPTELQDLMSSTSNTTDSAPIDTVTQDPTFSPPSSSEIQTISQNSSNDYSIESPTYVEPTKKGFHWLKVFFVSILKLVLVLIVGKLAWECNKSQTFILRVMYTTIACMFSELYIIYYAIYRTYLGNSCPIV